MLHETISEWHSPCRPSFPSLAAELVSEVAQCTRFKESKAYLAGIVKVLLALPLSSQDSTAIKGLRALVGTVSLGTDDHLEGVFMRDASKLLGKRQAVLVPCLICVTHLLCAHLYVIFVTRFVPGSDPCALF